MGHYHAHWGVLRGVRLGRELVLYLDSKEVQLHLVLRESLKSIMRNRLLTDSFSHPTWTFTFNRGQLRRTLQMINGYLSMAVVIVKTSSKIKVIYFQTQNIAKCTFDQKIWWGT